jgi:hypothetical protein
MQVVADGVAADGAEAIMAGGGDAITSGGKPDRPSIRGNGMLYADIAQQFARFRRL